MCPIADVQKLFGYGLVLNSLIEQDFSNQNTIHS